MSLEECRHPRGGLALSTKKNKVLFAYYRMPSPTVVILSAKDGAILTTLPTGVQVDTVAFNTNTIVAISAEGGGTLTIIKENSPTSFSGRADSDHHARRQDPHLRFENRSPAYHDR